MTSSRHLKINLVLGQQSVFPPIRGGGVENLNWMLAREFARMGHQVVAYSREVPELPASETDSYGIRHVRIPGFDLHPSLSLDHWNAFRWACRLALVLEPADITSFHTAFSFLLRYRRGLGICTHTIHRTPKRIVSLYRNLDRLYCGADAVRLQALALDPGLTRLRRVYNCVDVFPDEEPPPPLLIPSGTPLRLLYVGRFARDKGLESLIRGFALAYARDPFIQLTTVGAQRDVDGADGAFFDEMSSLVASLGLKECVNFQGPLYDRPSLEGLIRNSHVVCVPSLSGETFSMAVLEAMAAAKPVLVSDFAPMPEAITHRVAGFVAKAGDASSIAEGIGFFASARAELDLLGRAAFYKARECFSSRVIALQYLTDFHSLLGSSSARA